MLKAKNAEIICYELTSLVSLLQENVKKPRKSMKVAYIDRESLHSNLNQIFRKDVTYDIKSHKKVTRKEGFTLSSKDTFLEKPQVGTQPFYG